MDLVKTALTALERQIREAVEIRRAPQEHLLNLKEEYNMCLLPTMIMEGPKSIKEQEEQVQE